MSLRFRFLHSDKPRERILADAVCAGVIANGDIADMRPLEPDMQVDPSVDVVGMVGVKSRELFRKHWDAGIHIAYFDKGYTRQSSGETPIKTWEYWRVAINAHHPTGYFQKIRRKPDRYERLGLDFAPWRRKGQYIVFAGSSQKYHDFYGLSHPTTYAAKTIKQLEYHAGGRPIIYRPKPSWKDAEPINGTEFSRPPETIVDVLKDAHCLVTHGSNACFEAIQMGVPCIILGDAVAKPISSQTIEEVKEPHMVHDKRRRQWFYDLAYCQFTLPEFHRGEAWGIIRPQIYG